MQFTCTIHENGEELQEFNYLLQMTEVVVRVELKQPGVPGRSLCHAKMWLPADPPRAPPPRDQMVGVATSLLQKGFAS